MLISINVLDMVLDLLEKENLVLVMGMLETAKFLEKI